MPIYEFECPSCGHHFDHLQKLSDADPTVCPACQAEPLHRMLSAPSFRLAGTGWYETDFKKAGDARHNLAGDAGAPHAGDKPAGDKPAGHTPAGDQPASDKHVAPAQADKSAATKAGDGAKPAPATAPAQASTGDRRAAASGD